MIIFRRLPDGTWERSGAILPTEAHYQIAVDAQNPERMIYPCDHAIQEVENRIKAGTTAYRFELAMPPAIAKRKAANEQKIKKIVGRPEKAKAMRRARKSKAKKSGKPETGKQRRARLKREGLCTACGTRKARRGFTECKTCADYYNKWAAKKAKKAGKR